MSDSLKQLLRQADQTPNVPDPRELAARVRRTRKEQVRQHRLVISVAMVLLMSCVVVMWPKSGNRNVAKTSVTETPEATEIDMRLHALTAEALLMSERASRARARAEAQVDPIAQVQFQRDRAAMTLVYEAERFCAAPRQTDLAMAQYRKVIELFPTSTWAEVARQRLRELSS